MSGGDDDIPLVFYDSETTGTNLDFDQIVQFAAIRTTRGFKEIERFTVRCRRLPWVVPSPTALLTNGLDPLELDDPSLPLFPEMVDAIRERFVSWSPSVFLGYNSFRFDEQVLQRAFWQNLHPPYLTSSMGNRRVDVLPAVRAASRVAAHSIAVPKGRLGRASYRLDRVAPLNGFSQRSAHDALEDVEATIHIARRIASRATKIWNLALVQSSSMHVLRMLRQRVPVFVLEPEAAGKIGWWGLYLGEEQSYLGGHLLARLDHDWQKYFSLSDPEQVAFLRRYPWPIARVRVNRAPLMLDAEAARTAFGIVPSKIESEVAQQLLGSSQRVSSLINLYSDTMKIHQEDTEVEQTMFQQFPSKEDERLMREFHSVPWDERRAFIRRFQDGRFQQLSQRLVYLMAPETLTQEENERVHDGIRRRVVGATGGATPWRTVAMAKGELENASSDFIRNQALARRIKDWLDNLASSA